jgi:outer membrane protein, heavy metal efflux system
LSARVVFILLGAMILGLGVVAIAKGDDSVPPPGPLTEKTFAEWLARSSPRAAAIATAGDIAAADVVTARRLPNPEIGYSDNSTVSGTDTIGGDVHSVSLGLALPVFGQRHARVEAALAHQAATGADVEARRLELAREGRRAFVELLGAQEKRAVREELVHETERVAKIVEGRAAAGKKSQYDVERIRLELANDQRLLGQARAGEEEAAGRLAALAGLPDWHPRADGKLAPRGVDTDVARLWSHAETTLPALKAGALGHAADVADIEVARREGWPVPQLTVGEQSTTDPHGVAVSAGISVPLPVFDRNQGEIARKGAEANASALELEATRREARAELESAVAVLERRRETLAAFDRDASDRVPRLKEMADAFYQSGEGSIVDLLDALNAIGEARLGRIELLAELVPAELDVEFAAGLDVSPS